MGRTPAPSRSGSGRRAVAVGGGHGLARVLRALPRVVDHVTAVVTVADDGGSSGRLRRDLDVLPPGDLRMALTAMAADRELAELVAYRFVRGELAGHSLGNLILVALHDLCDDDVVAALDRLAAALQVPGRVLPCTLEPVSLHAVTSTGEVSGQAAIAATPNLERVWLEPDRPTTHPDVVAAIEQADLVVLGPGSLYTSLLPNLLVPAVGRALAETSAPVALITNLREQPGETEGMTLHEHLDVLAAHAPGLEIGWLIAHQGRSPSGAGVPLTVDDALAGRVGEVLCGDLLDGHDGHDPHALAAVLGQVLPRR